MKAQPCHSAEKEHVVHGWLFSFQSTELGSKIRRSKRWKQATGRDVAAPAERLSAEDRAISA